MDGQQVAVLSVVLLAVLGAAAPVAGVTAAALDTDTAEQETTQQGTTGADENESAMGARVSSFMQSSAASAEGNVDAGMWNERFEDAPADRRPELVNQRVDTLRERLQELREQREALLDGGNATMTERAKAARLAARARALSEAIDGTERAAEQTGVNATSLDELRRGARNLTGQEIADLTPGADPGAQSAGPPDGVRANGESQGNGSVPPGTSGAPGTEGNETGSEAAPNVTRNRTTGSDGQPPGESGSSEGGGSDNGGDGNAEGSGDGSAEDAGHGGGSSGNSDSPPEDSGNGGGSDGNTNGDNAGSDNANGDNAGGDGGTGAGDGSDGTA